ncbi:MAG: CCA tRNA nucleotidyltransferase [bacterium]|nr:CCA tRNA nucleotidyltransferase [bacterium]
MSSTRGNLFTALPGEARAVIEQALELGRRCGIDVFLVGGAVRDLYLDEPVYDVDLVWVGPGEPANLSLRFAELFDCEFTYHPEFLTASFMTPSGLRVDLGRARSEFYRKPAALPSVRPGDLRDDLVRRDFAVNAMAVPLEEPDRLVDPCGGAKDLEHRRLRALHARSFQDDPTRILRGLELAVRRGFRFDSATRARAEEAIREEYLALVSGTRLAHELARLLSSPRRAVSAAEWLRAFDIDRALHEEFRIDGRGLERLGRMADWSGPERDSEAQVSTPYWVVALTALLWERPRSTRRYLADRLSLGRGEARWLESGPERIGPLLVSGSAIEFSIEGMADLYALLSRDEARLAGLLVSGDQADVLGRARKLAGVELGIGGEDLLAAGAPAGPRIGAALDATLKARRAGRIEEQQELEFALEWLGREDRGDAEP